MKRALALSVLFIFSVSFMASFNFEITAFANFVPWSPPEIVIFSPLQNQTYHTDVPMAFSLTLSGNGPDSDALTSLNYSVDGKPSVAVSFSHSFAPYVPTNFDDTLMDLSNGVHNLVIHGSTIMDLSFSSNVSFTVNSNTQFADNNPPTVSILSPQNQTYASNGAILNFWVNKPIAYAEFSINNRANATIFGNDTELDYVDGENSLTVYAVDVADNVGVSDTIRFAVNEFFFNPTYNTLLPTPISPIISVISPQNVTYNVSNVQLRFTINQPLNQSFIQAARALNLSQTNYPTISWIGYSLDGKNRTAIQGNTTLTDLPGGPHSLTVCANDTSGNLGASQTVFFYTAAKPFPVVISVAVLGVVLAVIVSFVYWFYKKAQGKKP